VEHSLVVALHATHRLAGRPDDHRHTARRFGQDARGVGADGAELVTHRRIHEAGHDDREDLGLERMRPGPDPDGRRQIVVAAVPRIARRPHRWIRRDVNLLALGHQGEAGERVGVLAADQDADAAQPRLAHTQTGAVAIGPRELLPERRHELAVVIEHAAVAAMRSSSGPGQRTALAASCRNQPWLWMGAASADQTGNAGIYASGKATS